MAASQLVLAVQLCKPWRWLVWYKVGFELCSPCVTTGAGPAAQQEELTLTADSYWQSMHCSELHKIVMLKLLCWSYSLAAGRSFRVEPTICFTLPCSKTHVQHQHP